MNTVMKIRTVYPFSVKKISLLHLKRTQTGSVPGNSEICYCLIIMFYKYVYIVVGLCLCSDIPIIMSLFPSPVNSLTALGKVLSTEGGD